MMNRITTHDEPGLYRARVLLLTMLALAVGSVLWASAAHASEPFGFGISSFETSVSSPQAGAHADFTTSFSLNTEALGGPAGQIKNVTVHLPEGLVGDPQDIPRCTPAQLTEFDCQPSAQVGVFTSHFFFTGSEEPEVEEQTGVYNMTPDPGHPATFATSLAFATVIIEADVTRDGTYRLVASVHEISTLEPVVATSLTMWGVPADPSHDAQRFGPPPNYGTGVRAGAAPAPFMINSSDCTDGALGSELTAESWQGESAHTNTTMQAPIGCSQLHAAPTISVTPDTKQAGSPAGYEVDLGVPQELAPYALATPDLRDAVVTLPAGTVVSPSAANGLQACSEAQIGLNNGNQATCPDASKVGEVEIITPLLGKPLKGSVYAATQDANPFKSLLAIYIAAEDEPEGEGVQVKLAGKVTPNPVTGQLTTSFANNPKVPFSELKVKLFGESTAALSNPTACGQAKTTSQLTFYNSPIPAEPSSAFEVSGCTGPQFAPSFTAGTTNPQAGGFSPQSVTISRSDADQYLSGVKVTEPQGLLAMLASVPLCGEPQISKNECSPASQIGHVTTGAGPGSTPFYLPEAGQPPNPVYLTTGYKGAPFGLSIVVPAIAGPFNLGVVRVRAAISVDPNTAQAGITSDPLPQILEGIPLQVRTVNVDIDRPGFIFNPTSCGPQSLTGTLLSAQGLSAAVQSPFQTANCKTLPFKPVFKASTQGNGTFKNHGASLTVKVSTHQGPTATGGRESDIAKVDVQLPISLPSRTATLQKACTAQQFAADPRGCPPAATVGTAIAHTPVLPVPLEGPAILVSHAGLAFPDLVLMLQGDGVTVDLTGHTQITKGITFSHFETVPDAPISSFELKLPEGQNSILAAFLPRGTLCEPTVAKTVVKTVKHVRRKVKEIVPAPLLMPTTITAQNGAVLKQTTKIAVTGCPKAAKAASAKKARRARTAHTNRKAVR
jgi:hypothetical protein